MQSIAATKCTSFYKKITANQPVDYFNLMEDLLSPEGQTALGEVISNPVPKLELKNGTITRSNSAWPIPHSLRNILPKPWSRKFNNSSAVNTEVFYRDLNGKYEATFNKNLILAVLEANENLEYSNTTYGEVRDTVGVVGTWRWFEANAVDQPGSPYDLPYVRMNKARNVPNLKVTEKLKSFMSLGLGVTEIGSFSVKSPMANIRERTTHIIEAAWLRISRNDEIYIAHVASMAHARLYRKYGFEIAEIFTTPGSNEQEAILWVRGWQFKEALRKILNVSTFIQAPHNRVPFQYLLPSETR